MLTKYQIRTYLLYAFLAAMTYSAIVGIFIYYQSYNQSWLLYMGNFLFGIVIAIFLYRYSRKNSQIKVSQLIAAGQITSIMGIGISCITCLILLFVFTPAVFVRPAAGVNILKNAPGQLQQGNSDYLLMLFMDAVIGNVGTGSFIAILFPFTFMRYPKGQ